MDGGDAALGGETDDFFDEGGSWLEGGGEVVEGGDEGAQMFEDGHAGDHPGAEGGAVAVVDLLKDFGPDAGHVDVGGAFAAAGLAGEAGVEDLTQLGTV